MTQHSLPRGRAPAGIAGSTARSSRTGDPRLRHALSYLAGFEYPVELRTLAAHVAADEHNVPVETVSDRVRESVAVALHHVDLPKLVAAGVVRYDPESRMVVATETDSAGRYVDVIEGSRRSDAV